MSMKKTAAFLLAASMLLSAASCSSGTGTAGSSAAGSADSTSEAAGTESAEETPANTEGVTIQFWHTRGAGPNGDQVEKAVSTFNETNESGITVEQIYQGSYVDTLAKVMQSVAAGNAPQVVMLERAAGIPVAASGGALYDMSEFIERDNFDMDNFPEALLGFSYYDDQIVSLPYCRSTPVFYYNVKMLEDANLEVPTTIDEMVNVCSTLAKTENGETSVYGFELLNDPAWYVQNMLYQLGSNLISEDGKSCPALEDGTMLKVLTAWREWVDAGWCASPTVTDAATALEDQFSQGKIACFIQSCGSMRGIIENATAAGVEVGVAYLPTWTDPSAPTGGGNIAIMSPNTTEEQAEAAWQFIKFLMSDEQVADNSISTGYVPVTKSVTENADIQALWEEDPRFKVAYDQLLECGQELPWSDYKNEFETAMVTVCSKLIIDRSITPEEAVEELKTEASTIFPQ